MSKSVILNNGAHMPTVGFGTFQAKDEELESALQTALEAGYRHIDTAYAYQNEKVIGKVLNEWISSGKLKREDLFIVTKLPTCGIRAESVNKFITKSLEDLQLDYVDLYLIHSPFGFIDNGSMVPVDEEGKIMLDMKTDLISTWMAMEEQVDNGKAKAIGISNFNIKQIERIWKIARIQPANLQIELHAYHQQKALVGFCMFKKITVTAYAPIGSPGLSTYMQKAYGVDVKLPNILENPIVKLIASDHQKTEGQILLRHGVQKGIIVIPKSISTKRIQDNLNIFDFQLNEFQMDKLNSLNQGDKGRLFDFKNVPGVTEHPEYPMNSHN